MDPKLEILKYLKTVHYFSTLVNVLNYIQAYREHNTCSSPCGQ